MSSRPYTALAVAQEEQLVFGRAPHPVTCGHQLAIGAGTVYPEINFTLPPMEVTAATMPAVREQYTQIIDGVCKRAVDLAAPGLVVEFELLPPMTEHPEWGEQVVAFVVLAPGAVADSATLDRWCRNNIAGFKRPKRYEFLPALPKNSYGKVLKTALRDLLAGKPV